MSRDGHPMTRSPLDVMLVIPGESDQARLAEALSSRHVQLLDDQIAAPWSGPVVLALVGKAGHTSVFVNSRDELIDPEGALTLLRPHLQHLLGHGSFEEGGMLVLGRDRPKSLGTARAYLPNLLTDLRAQSSGARAGDLCRRGLSSMRRGRPSAATGLLWWEFARTKTERSPYAASAALALAANEFRRARIVSHAGRATALARRMEGRSQLDLFHSPDPVRVPGLRYEIVPVSYAGTTVEAGPLETVGAVGRDRRWKQVGRLELDSSAIDHASLIGAEIVFASAAVKRIDTDRFELGISLDLAPRQALGVRKPSSKQTLSYSLSSPDVSVAPHTRVGRAGDVVRFDLKDFRSKEANLILTATDEFGQLSHVAVELHLDDGGFFDASFRLRGARAGST